MATDTERGRKPLHVAALMTIAVVSAFALLIAAAGIAQTAAAKRDAGPRCACRPAATAMRSAVLS
jgi:hypothetical protein